MPSLVLVRKLVQVPGPVPPSAAGQRASANWPTAPAQALPIAVFSLPLALVLLVADFASGHGPTILPAATPPSHFCSSLAIVCVSLPDSFATVARHLFPAA